MTDFRTWIVGQSAKLGYDFNALTREDQENIISALLSYAEDAFRSQCDYPDMRFGKRRGIYGAKSNEELPLDPKHKEARETQNYLLSSNSQNCTDDGCENNTATSCGDANRCVDNNCTNSAGCANDTCEDVACKNFVDCHDEGCKDDYCRNTATCRDDHDCTDCDCTNSYCPDETTSANDPTVTDTRCINSYKCNDDGKCMDSKCTNSGDTCNDNTNPSGHCSDYECANTANQCTDDVGCVDDCLNDQYCSDSECYDEMCFNYRGCDDSSNCHDNACANANSSKTDVLCIDRSCKDEPCFNYAPASENSCSDSTITTTCGDTGCINQTKKACQNLSDGVLGCGDMGCVNYPRFQQTCPNVADEASQGCTDEGVICRATEDKSNCYIGSDHSGHVCIDAGRTHCTDSGSGEIRCTDSQYCQNNGNCFDNNCIDDYCVNSSKSTCRDDSNCEDTHCKNEGFCQNATGQCTDNQCNNAHCINIGLGCVADSQSACTNGKCFPFNPPS